MNPADEDPPRKTHYHFSHVTTGRYLPTPGPAPRWPFAEIGHWTIDVNASSDDWTASLREWRREHLARIGYDDANYRRPELQWAQRNFVHAQMMVEDRYFHDPVAKKYTVDRYLDDLEARYGGIDSVLIWYVYPNIGVDDRNQFDLAHDLPGGLEGLRGAVEDFHRRGVKVFLPTMPWDHGTREQDEADWLAVAKIVKAVGADGLNGDTYNGVPRAFFDACDALGCPVVCEPESTISAEEQLIWNVSSWGKKAPADVVPSVAKFKWAVAAVVQRVALDSAAVGRDRADAARGRCARRHADDPAGDFDFVVHGIEIEGQTWAGLDVQYPWESTARRSHRRRLRIEKFHIDRTSVTNAQFRRFIEATKYTPDDIRNFLRDWQDSAPPPGWENKPVTWVSLEDARAYAAWAGKRLPREWEWRYAAQGNDGRAYPWGNDWNDATAPRTNRGRHLVPPADVDAHPQGASPFGVLDLVGNIWQWTDEYEDEHARAAVLRGGSSYQPQTSHWYFPQAHRLDQHGKLLLMAPGKDRSGMIGFRCVVDAE